MAAPGPSANYMIKKYLDGYTLPHRGESSGDMYLGDTAPITPEVFRQRMVADLGAYPNNEWELPADFEKQLDAATALYAGTYAAWVNTDLESDAGITRPDVVKWQTEARTAKP